VPYGIAGAALASTPLSVYYRVFQKRTEWTLRLGVLTVLVLVGALYAATLGFGFVWDDEQVIYGRVDYRSPSRWLEAVRQPLDFSPNYFRPLALSSLLVQIWLWGENPAPFHAANVLIHLLNTALVSALGLRLFRGRWYGLLVGALYGVHPALVESVAFVSSRYDLMVTLFLLTALWLEGRSHGATRVVGVATAFLLALLCKEMALTMPLVMLLWQLAQREGDFSRASLVRLLRQERTLYGGLLVALGVYFSTRYAALGYLFTAALGYPQIDAGTPLQHLLLVGRTLTTLVGLVVFPFFSITAAHHSELPIPLGDGWAWAQLALAGAIVAGVVWAVRCYPQAGWLLAAGLVGLLPVLNLRPLEMAFGIFTAERFLTFPLALFLLGLAIGVAEWASQVRNRAYLVRGAVAAWGVALFIAAAYNLPNWRDAESLWKWLTTASPCSPIGWSNLSDFYNKQGRYTEGLEYAEKAIQIAPRSGMGYVNKGFSLLKLGNRDEATTLFRRATELEPENIVGWNNLAMMLSEQGANDEAEQIVRERVLGRPPKFMAHQALGLIYARKMRLDLAETEFKRTCALIPNPKGSAAEWGLQELQRADKWIAAAHQWMNERNLELAERHLQGAAARDPNKIEYGVALSRLRILQNRPAEAKQILMELVESGYRTDTIEGLLKEAEQMLARNDTNRTTRVRENKRNR
jgi:tetratricopeptide (TPR) repeat protein